MPDSSPGSAPAADLITDLIARYGRQAVQLFAAFAGATGLFYAIGFIIVNVSLLRLGVYETALINVGYIVPGVAFAIIFSLSAVASIGAFETWRRVFGATRFGRFMTALAGLLTVGLGSLLLGWAMWFFKNVASGLVLWSFAVNVGVAIMTYADELPLTSRMFTRRMDDEGNPLSALQTRLRSPAFVLVAAGLAFASVLTYGQSVYDQIPPVFGGGLPIVVRFYGSDVGKLEKIGIGPEPGQANLTERIELITQTEDRYIVRVGNRAISFDKSFVQGIRYEPPEFFLDAAFFLATHTKQGERFLADARYDEALSEFNLVLNGEPGYGPALRGRALVSTAKEDFEQALVDYRQLTETDPNDGENFYSLATVHVLRGQSLGTTIPGDEVVAALEAGSAVSPTLIERARADRLFDTLRGGEAFDRAVYESGLAATRWFEDRAQSAAESGNIDNAIVNYSFAISYTIWYESAEDRLSPIEVAGLHVALSDLYLQRDPLSGEAVAELEVAASVGGLSPTDRADLRVRLSNLYLSRDRLSNEALAELEKAASVEGLSPQRAADLYVDLSQLHLQRDPQSDAAVAALRSAIDVTGRNDPAYMNLLADLYRARGDVTQALAQYKEALSLSTENGADFRLALIGQGRIALGAGEYLLARDTFSDTIKLSPADAAAWYDYARALASLGEEGTASALRRAFSLDLSLASTAQITDSVQYFSKAGSAVENLIDAAVIVRQARASRDQGKIDEAVAAYKEATTLDPDVVIYWREYGDVLTQQELYEDAVVAYQNVLQRSEEADATVLSSLGLAQIGTRDYAGAIESLTASINARGDSAPARIYVSLASAYELTGQYDLAGATYQQAALRDPSRSEYPYRAGIDLLLAGQVDQGLSALQAIVDQGWLRVESTDILGLRETASTGGVVLKTLAVGTVLRISGDPQAGEGKVWWPVVDQDGTQGWVRAAGVVPSAAPVSQAPVVPTAP